MRKLRMATPGPTQVPTEILLAGAQETIHHRSPQMEELIEFTNLRLKQIFGTKQSVYTMLSSGTGAMEAAVCNCFNRGDKVLIVYNGYWGERFNEICQQYGVETILIESPWGTGVDVQHVAEAARKHPDAAGILVTYSETATGVLNDIRQIGEIFRGTETLVVVDAISALITHPLHMDEWGIDIVLAASHKGFMMPPGLAFVAASERAWRRIERCTSPSYYFSLKRYRKFYPLAPSSPGVSLLLALRKSVELLAQEGVDAIIDRHRRISRATDRGLAALGFENVVKSPHTPNHVITVAYAPPGVNPEQLLAHLNSAYGVTMTGGQGVFKGKVIRFGHIGSVDMIDLHGIFGAVEAVLTELGHSFEVGASSRAIQQACTKVGTPC